MSIKEDFQNQKLDITEQVFLLGLDVTAFRAYFLLKYMSRGRNEVHATQEMIAKRLRLSAESVRKTIRRLEAAEALSTELAPNPFSGKLMTKFTFSSLNGLGSEGAAS